MQSPWLRRDICFKRQEACVSPAAVGTEAQAETHKHTLWFPGVMLVPPPSRSVFLQRNPTLLHPLPSPLPPELTEQFTSQEPTAGLLGSRNWEVLDTCNQTPSESSCPAHLRGLPPSALPQKREHQPLLHLCSPESVPFFPLPLPGSSGHWLLLK